MTKDAQWRVKMAVYELIGELSAKLTPQDWISFYEKSKPKKK